MRTVAKRRGYGQFCPVAKASEIVAERWTPLVLRELVMGSRHFNEIRRGVPLMSPTLLSQRLRELEDGGIVARTGTGRKRTYRLTRAGEELGPIIESLGAWGARWTGSRLGKDDYDPSLLMWDIRRNVDVTVLPPRPRLVVRFELSGVARALRRWWLVVDDVKEIDLCLKDPGYDVDVLVTAHVRDLTDVWMGRRSMRDARQAGLVTLDGSRAMVSSVVKSLKLSMFAAVARPAPEPSGS